MDQEKIGAFIKKIRKDNNLSQQAFANKLGVSFQAVSKWENGKNLPDISTLKRIKKEFKINIDEIIEGEKINKKTNKRKIILIITIIIILLFIIFITLTFQNLKNIKFEFDEITSTSKEFKVSGSVVKTDTRTSIIINDVIYNNDNDNTVYEELNCNLYEEKQNTKKNLTTCETGKNITIKTYLENLKIRMDHYEQNCKMFTENKMFIEINAQKNNKTIIYKIPIKIKEDSCYQTNSTNS